MRVHIHARKMSIFHSLVKRIDLVNLNSIGLSERIFFHLSRQYLDKMNMIDHELVTPRLKNIKEICDSALWLILIIESGMAHWRTTTLPRSQDGQFNELGKYWLHVKFVYIKTYTKSE